jgi:chromosome segregation ATPase
VKNLSIIISLLAVIIAAILGGLYWRSASDNSRLELSLSSVRSQNQALTTDLASAQELTKHQQVQLHSLDDDLGETKTSLTSARSNLIILQRQIEQLETNLAKSKATQRQLRGEVSSLSKALTQARASDASPETIASYQQAIRRLEQQLAALQSPTTQSLAIPVLTTHRSRSTRVVSVGPSNAFVVLNYGASHGALPSQRMDIRRGTKQLATVQISDVRENYSIAQVRPDSLRDSLQRGDLATLTP